MKLGQAVVVVDLVENGVAAAHGVNIGDQIREVRIRSCMSSTSPRSHDIYIATPARSSTACPYMGMRSHRTALISSYLILLALIWV